ncbi:hypothetical protein, partial [Pararoseomonas baculiformis]|uniref:hypothetical protein n=1 Tax=Pararoseomonas baculiformis TaxID=2820812 RepID=UPI001ADF28DF
MRRLSRRRGEGHFHDPFNRSWSALNNQQPVDLEQESSGFGMLELQGSVGTMRYSCDSVSHE